MSKKPVPKRHQCRSSTRSRFASFQHQARVRLSNGVKLVECANCHEQRQTHYVCPHCGFYKGRQIVQVEKTKKAVQKIKA